MDLAQERESVLHARRKDVRKLQEELVRAKKEIDNLSEKIKNDVKARNERIAMSGETELQVELNKCMVSIHSFTVTSGECQCVYMSVYHCLASAQVLDLSECYAEYMHYKMHA